MNQLLDLLKQAGLNLSAEEISDILWLALQILPSSSEQVSQPSKNSTNQQGKQDPTPNATPDDKPITPKFNPRRSTPTPTKQTVADAPLYARTSGASAETQGGVVFKTPSAVALPESLQLAKSLKPFMRRVASHTETLLDEVATAERIAEEKIPVPVLRPAPEKWFDLALIVDDSSSMGIWQRTILELQQLLERHGAFRHVQTWGLLLNENGQIRLRSGVGAAARNRRLHSPNELVDSGNQRLFLVVSDCVSPLWRNGTITSVLAPWVKTGPLAIVQMLPERLWERTALGLSAAVQFRALSPGVSNQKLVAEDLAAWDDADVLKRGLKVPVVTLEPEPLAAWARMVAGVANATSPGFIIESPEITAPVQPDPSKTKQEPIAPSAGRIVQRFLNTASPTARKLAGLLAAAPVISLPIVRLLQRTLLEQLRQVHIAEVFLGGILKATSSTDTHTDPDYVQYEFVEPEVRSLLLDAAPLSNSTEVLQEVSSFIAERAGLSLHEFMAILEDPTLTKPEVLDQQVQPFAQVTAQVLRRLGGDYVQMAERMERQFNQQEVDPALDSSPQKYEIVVTPMGRLFQGHTASVRSVVFSPDGKRIVSGSDDNTVQLWNLDGTPIGFPFQGHTDSVRSVAFSPDGQKIVSGSDDSTVRLWNLDGTPIGSPFQGHTDSVRSVAFSPDGQTIVSGSDDNTVRLWNLDGIPIAPPFQGHTYYISSVTFSPDGQKIVSGSADNTVRLWNLDGTSIGSSFQGHTKSVSSVAFSPDGQTIISGSDDNTVRLWNFNGTSIGSPFQGHAASIKSVAFSPDGQSIVSGSADNTVRLWNLNGQTICEPIQGYQDMIWAVTFSPDGRIIASGGQDRTVRLWSLQPHEKSTSTLHALLIGIDYYKPNPFYKNLKGSIPSVNLVTNYLQKRLHMPLENILQLLSPLPEQTDSYASCFKQGYLLPTYENIVYAFQQLTQSSLPGDQVLIYYSGHGGRIKTIFPDLKGEDSEDECLVPMDCDEGRVLRDVELETLLQRMREKGLNVTVVIDSSHSGGMLKDG